MKFYAEGAVYIVWYTVLGLGRLSDSSSEWKLHFSMEMGHLGGVQYCTVKNMLKNCFHVPNGLHAWSFTSLLCTLL